MFMSADLYCCLFPLRFCKRISNVFVASDGSIHLIPKWQQIHYSFVFILTDPQCLDRIWRIQKNHWLKTGHWGPGKVYELFEWIETYFFIFETGFVSEMKWHLSHDVYHHVWKISFLFQSVFSWFVVMLDKHVYHAHLKVLSERNAACLRVHITANMPTVIKAHRKPAA